MTAPVSMCPVGNCVNDLGQRVICSDHLVRLENALGGGLARLYVELNIALRPGRIGSDEPVVTTSQVQRLPISTEARAAQQDILATLLATEAGLRVASGWAPAPRRGREGPTLNAACAVLLDHLPTVLALPGGVPFAQTLLAIVSQARFATGRTGGTKTNRIDIPCPECDMRSLRRDNGTDVIACAYCGCALTAQQLDDLLDPPIQREAA